MAQEHRCGLALRRVSNDNNGSLGFIKVVAVTGNMAPLTLELSIVSDLIAVPLYASILYELCRPGQLSLKMILAVEAPFVVLPVLLATFRHPAFYYVDMALALLLGLGTAVWTCCFAIPRYHRHLKATFSYDDDINLKWLQSILWIFFVILTLWVISCVSYRPWLEVAYIVPTLFLWIFVCYFLYRHKSVVDELRPITKTATVAKENDDTRHEVFARIKQLIEAERIYLNPQLKLSDIARMAHTNRTYASAYFSTEARESFYDHINRLRIEYAITLMPECNHSLEEIAELSGFNSRQSFHRVFISIKGQSPSDFRTTAQFAVNQQ